MAEGAIVNTQLVRFNTLRSLLDQSKEKIQGRLPVHLNADRMIKVALTALNKDTKLLTCTRESVLLSVMQAAELGLEPGGSLGEGYLVPYNCKVKDEKGNERWEMQAKFIPGYRGLIVLARRSGEISNIYAEAVYKGDKIEIELGLNPKLLHVPDFDSDERDKETNLTFTYAVAKFKDGSFQFVVLSRKQIEKLKARSKAANSGPWVTDYEEMAKKTAIRRLSKHLPLSVELAKALEIQGAAESGDFVVLDGAAEFELGAGAAPDPEALMDKLGWSEADRKTIRKSYDNNPAGLLDYLLKKTAPLTQTVTLAGTTQETKQAEASTASTQQASQTQTAQQTAGPQKAGRGRPTREQVAAREAAKKVAEAQGMVEQTEPETQEEHEQSEAEENQEETTAQAEVPETGKFSF